MELITAQQMLDAIRAEVEAEGPDHRYEVPKGYGVCRYTVTTPDGSLACSCLIARALVRLDVPVEELARYEGLGAGQLGPEYFTAGKFGRVGKGLPQLLTREAALVADAAQSTQDAGKLWGLALEQAESMFNGIVAEAALTA